MLNILLFCFCKWMSSVVSIQVSDFLSYPAAAGDSSPSVGPGGPCQDCGGPDHLQPQEHQQRLAALCSHHLLLQAESCWWLCACHKIPWQRDTTACQNQQRLRAKPWSRLQAQRGTIHKDIHTWLHLLFSWSYSLKSILQLKICDKDICFSLFI